MLKRFLQKYKGDKHNKMVVVVSGLPRSGTSMLMKMLEAGGIPPLTDKIRTADSDNPKGYYEFERVKQLDKGDAAWVSDAVGKAVKVISALLKHLPSGYNYKIVFVCRRLEEVLASQKKMLINRGEATDKVSDEELITLFQEHLRRTFAWINSQPNIELLEVDYNELLNAPTKQAEEINQFLGNKLNVQKMLEVIDINLYRQRRFEE